MERLGLLFIKTEETEEGEGLSHTWSLLLDIDLAWNFQKLKKGQ